MDTTNNEINEKNNEKFTKRELMRLERLKAEMEELSRQLQVLETKKQREEQKRLNHAKYLYVGMILQNMKTDAIIKELQFLMSQLKRKQDKDDVKLLIDYVNKRQETNQK
jgi:hypothetical protein